MRTKLVVIVTALGLLVAAVPAWAHHAFAAEFDQNKPIKVQGSVVKWELTNPHSWIHIDVKGADGNMGGMVPSGPTISDVRLEV